MYWRFVFVVRLTLFGVLVIVAESSSSGVSILTNAYAKVAKWGATIAPNTQNVGEARGNGQSFFTQSSDVNLRSGQNLKDEKVVYHYSMPAQNVPIAKRIDAPTKKPGFRDRFNPPPAFQFGDSKRNVPNDHDHSHQDIGPVYSPPKDSYNSPISSYSPVASGIPDAGQFAPSGPKYPPFNDEQSDAHPSKFKGPAAPDTEDISDYGVSNGKAPNMNGDVAGDDGGGNNGYQYNPSLLAGYQYNLPTAPPILPTPVPSSPTTNKPASQVLPTLPISHHYKFPSYVYARPPSGYDSPGDDHGHDQPHHDHRPDDNMSGSGNDTPDMSHQPSDYPNPDYNDVANPSHDDKHSPDDLPEYLEHDPSLKGKLNHFSIWSNLYDDHDHHYVHRPDTTTTTTPPPPPPTPEDENRVNKGHYSYYYLGRKLYYVPLYFSVYFIIYITVLILKSIARHKVSFVHELHNVNKARSLGSFAYVSNSTLDDLAEQTTRAVGQFKRRYIAM